MVASFKPLKSGTAHQRLAKSAGIDAKKAIGGSIKTDGKIELRSESLNVRKVGDCDATGTDAGENARRRIAKGEFVTRKQLKDIRQMMDDFENLRL